MKLIVPALLLAGVLLVAAPGCNKASTPAISVSTVPSTTTVDGKTVPLKSTPSGLKYYDSKVGTGPSPKSGQTAAVQYTGTLLDGTKFDSSYDHGSAPFSFPVGMGRVIAGWDEGVATMKVGGKRRLVIPGALAYGPNPPPGAPIPPDATLVFDIELVSVQ
jgi:peptidylprolyl isomerase